MKKESKPNTGKFSLCINRNFTGKVNKKKIYDLNTGFQVEELTPEAFIDVVKAGHPYTMVFDTEAPIEGTGRKTAKTLANFKERWEISLDDDSGDDTVFGFWGNDLFFRMYGFMLAESSSSTKKKQKAHPIFLLDEPITDKELVKEIYEAFHYYYPRVDKLKNADRTLYNKENGDPVVFGNRLTFKALETNILGPYRKYKEEKEAEKPEVVQSSFVPSDDSLTNFVYGGWKAQVVGFANVEEGENRHAKLLGLGAEYSRLCATDWAQGVVERIGDPMPNIVKACELNGYLSDYAEDDPTEIKRIFDDGAKVDNGRLPLPLPPMNQYIKTGDFVEIKATGATGYTYCYVNKDEDFVFGIVGLGGTYTEDELTAVNGRQAFKDVESALNALETLKAKDIKNYVNNCIMLNSEEIEAVIAESDAVLSLEDFKKIVKTRKRLESEKAKRKTAVYNAKKKAVGKEPKEKGSPTVQSGEILDFLTDNGYSFAFNMLTNRNEANGEPITDGVEARYMTKINDVFVVQRQRALDAVKTACEDNSYHPVKDYFNGLPEWDGTDYLKQVIDAYKYQKPKFAYTVSEIWFTNVIAKVFYNTQNFMIVEAGAQGIGKGYKYQMLCPSSDWIVTRHPKLGSKDDMSLMTIKLFWEFDELQGVTSKAGREEMKSLLTLTEIDYRTPYARHSQKLPVLASFVGSINDEGNGFLDDKTGNRRFIPLTSTLGFLEEAKIDWTEFDLTQFWAQIYALFKKHGHRKLPKEVIAELAEVEQEYTTRYAVEDIFEENFTYDASLPKTSLTVFTLSKLIQLMQENHGLNGNQLLHRAKLTEYLVKLTGEKAKRIRLKDSKKVPFGWAHIKYNEVNLEI